MLMITGPGANLSALVGALVCLVAGVARLTGHSYLLGFESMTLFTGGMALMLFGALLKLESVFQLLKKRAS